MPFRENDSVLAYHGPMLYEAKVIGVDVRPSLEEKESSYYYKIHYKGWNAKWDEYVRANRVLPIDEESLQKQKDLANKHKPKAEKKREEKAEKVKAEKAEKEKSKEEIPRPPKRTREEKPPVTPVEERPSLNIDLPEFLRYHLVDEWEAITSKSQLTPLPRAPCVKDVLAIYSSDYQRHPRLPYSLDVVEEWLAYLELYFDKSLGNYLLYRFEREQYLHIRLEYGNTFPMSQVYGAEHLLRLFVVMPDLASETQMDVESVEQLGEFSADLLRWLAGNQHKYFLSPLEQYDNSTSAYQNISRI